MRRLRVLQRAETLDELDLRLEAFDDPPRGSDDVLVAVRAAGVNRSDVSAALGRMPQAIWPRTPGREWSGVVVEGPSELIGRDTALQELKDLVSAYRVVTLTGPGGIGKTTLALELARALAAHFDGATGYLTIPSNAVLSIPTTKNLTWEGWINADLLQFPNNSNGYVDWMGKCANYGPTCEWEARMYTTTNPDSRPNRMSAYVFNPAAGLGSGADWQPANNLIMPSSWYYVVGEYTTLSAPSDCQNTSTYPGSINIWVNGVEWDQAQHGQTGCMSQYNVIPVANDSPLNIGTMAQDTWFPGAVGKVAVYDKLLTQAQITAHYQAMTGQTPTGSCTNTCTF